MGRDFGRVLDCGCLLHVLRIGFVRFGGLAILICGYLGTGVNRCAVICVYVCECVFIYDIELWVQCVFLWDKQGKF